MSSSINNNQKELQELKTQELYDINGGGFITGVVIAVAAIVVVCIVVGAINGYNEAKNSSKK